MLTDINSQNTGVQQQRYIRNQHQAMIIFLSVFMQMPFYTNRSSSDWPGCQIQLIGNPDYFDYMLK